MKGYKTLCEDCGDDEEPKQVGVIRGPDDRNRHVMDGKCHRHETESVEVEVEPVTSAAVAMYREVGE